MILRKYRKAFTLVELIIGLAVMGTIASFSTASYIGYQDMATKQQEKMDIQQIKNAVDNYYTANKKYPTSPLSKQPSPDVKDDAGNVTFVGFSKIDVQMLVDLRYLQDVPKLKNGEFFAVNYNGVVTVEKGLSESVIVEKGSIIVPTKADNMVEFEVYTGPNCTDITVYETNDKYVTSGSGTKLKDANPFEENGYYLHSGRVKVSAKQGQKYYVVKIKYSDETNVELRTSFQYALTADNIQGDIYWLNTSVNQNTQEGKETNVILSSSEVTKEGTAIKLNWTNRELVSGADAIRYEIEKYFLNTSNGKWELAPDSPLKTGATEIIDKAVNSSTKYKYNIYAFSASRNEDGSNKKTLNALETPAITPNTYKDTISYIENITRNDFNTSYNKNVSVRVGDIDDGVMSVTLFVSKVQDGNVEGFKAYKMNKTTDGTSVVIDENQTKITTDVYTVPIEVQDDYMIYYIEVIDARGVVTYCYMNPDLKKNDGEKDTDFEKRRQITSYQLPSNKDNYCYTLMRGLVEIFHDTYIDTSKIDMSVSDFHMEDGKVMLP